MSSREHTPGVWTGQISIAPRYHGELLTEAEQSGRLLENIMASRVEAHSALQTINKDLLEELENMVRLFHGYQGMELTSAKAAIKRARAQESTT